MMMKCGPVTNSYNNNVQFFYSFDDRMDLGSGICFLLPGSSSIIACDYELFSFKLLAVT